MEFILTQRRKVFDKITAKNYGRKGISLSRGVFTRYLAKCGEYSVEYDSVCSRKDTEVSNAKTQRILT